MHVFQDLTICLTLVKWSAGVLCGQQVRPISRTTQWIKIKRPLINQLEFKLIGGNENGTL